MFDDDDGDRANTIWDLFIFVCWLLAIIGGIFLFQRCAHAQPTPNPTPPIADSYRVHDAEQAWAKAHPGRAPTPEERRAIIEAALGRIPASPVPGFTSTTTVTR